MMACPQRLIELAENERTFISITPVEKLPESFLAEIRCRRLGMTEGEFAAMRVFDRNREIADERAIIGLPDTESIAPIRIDPETIDAIVKSKAAQRMRDWAEFLETRKNLKEYAA